MTKAPSNILTMIDLFISFFIGRETGTGSDAVIPDQETVIPDQETETGTGKETVILDRKGQLRDSDPRSKDRDR